MSRYIVSTEDVHHSCCYAAEVLDTETLDRHDNPERICECFDRATAEKIAAALNTTEVT